MDEKVYAVKIIPLRVMPFEAAVGHDILVRMVVLETGVVDDQRERSRHHPALVLDADLPLGEKREDRLIFVRLPCPAHAGISRFHDVADIVVIR